MSMRKNSFLLGIACLALAGWSSEALATGASHTSRSAASKRQSRDSGHHHRGEHKQEGDRNGYGGGPPPPSGGLPAKAMQEALHEKGKYENGELSVSVDRPEINNVHIGTVPIKPAFEISGSLDFQSLGNGRAFFNGDIPLKPSEINPVISAITQDDLSFQAEHQHMYDFEPMVWFIHIRGEGEAVELAHDVYNVLKQTSIPLEQEPPSNPKTPFDPQRLKNILHGYEVEVGEEGVVTVFVARRENVHINHVLVKPETNIATNIAFEPLNSSGSEAGAMPDFAMTANEINAVVGTMRGQGWDIGCLYNQETAEYPQLYFSHEFKTGDPYKLAEEIRKGLDRMNVQ